MNRPLGSVRDETGPALPAGTTSSGTGAEAAEMRRLRADLEVHPRHFAGRRQYWLAHPISGRVVCMTAADYHQLSTSGKTPHPADPQLVSEAAASGLLAADDLASAPAASPAASRPWWHHPLYIRLPGIPADGIASFLSRRTGWLFSRRAVVCWLIVVFAAAAAVFLQVGTLARAFDPLVSFQAKHWMFVLITLAGTKMLHELAHAAVCRRMGAAAREIGVLLLCGTPCLYCDVTDSWRVDSRLQRAAIMLAGIYVEMIIAAAAIGVWIISDDLLLRMAALHVACLCGASTILFNLNPLMRYDGYFVLSDLLGLPNLRSRAAEAWRFLVVRRLAGSGFRCVGTGGLEIGRSSLGGWALAAYHAAAALYRYVVVAALGGWAYLVLSRAGLEPLGRTGLVLLAMALVTGELVKVRKVVAGEGGWGNVARGRRWMLASLGCGLALLVLWVPVDRRVTAAGAVELHGAANIYAPRAGRIASVGFDYGQRVEQGAALASIDEPAMRIERERLSSQIEQLRIRRSALRRRALIHPESLGKWEEQSAAIAALEHQLRALDESLESMTLRAPRAGTVLPCLAVPTEAADRSAPLPPTTRLEARSGQTVAEGSVWCAIGDEHQKQVILEVDAAQRRFVEPGGLVQVQIDQSPAEVITCRVADISAMRHDPRAVTELLPSNRFRVACLLPAEVAGRVRIGATATGVIHGDPLRLWDWCVSRITGASY